MVALSEAEWECLYRVTRAEAGAQSKEAQKNVVYVVLNRINSEQFTQDNIIDVVFSPGQFTCVSNGSYYHVELSDFLKNNVREAFLDYQEGVSASGALFFTRGTFNLEFLFEDEVLHRFYK